MAKWFGKKKDARVVDEHNQPTEPIPAVVPAPQMDTVPAALQTPVASMPSRPNASPPANAPNAPKFDAYPYHQPAAEQGVSAPNPVKGGVADQMPVQKTRTRPFYFQFLPLGVGLVFVCVQLLLLVRFILRLFDVPIETTWISIVYALSNLPLLPFQAWLPPLSAFWPANIEIYTLLAVLVYGLISRLLVRLLKIVLGVR